MKDFSPKEKLAEEFAVSHVGVYAEGNSISAEYHFLLMEAFLKGFEIAKKLAIKELEKPYWMARRDIEYLGDVPPVRRPTSIEEF
jgi:hypothetical protein